VKSGKSVGYLWKLLDRHSDFHRYFCRFVIVKINQFVSTESNSIYFWNIQQIQTQCIIYSMNTPLTYLINMQNLSKIGETFKNIKHIFIQINVKMFSKYQIVFIQISENIFHNSRCLSNRHQHVNYLFFVRKLPIDTVPNVFPGIINSNS